MLRVAELVVLGQSEWLGQFRQCVSLCCVVLCVAEHVVPSVPRRGGGAGRTEWRGEVHLCVLATELLPAGLWPRAAGRGARAAL